jgi:hypothetical protein
MTTTTSQPRFQLGQLVITKLALIEVCAAEESVSSLVRRHLSGDWGDIAEDDKNENDFALCEGGFGCVSSAYALSNGVTVWIITKSDRSETTLMLDPEY